LCSWIVSRRLRMSFCVFFCPRVAALGGTLGLALSLSSAPAESRAGGRGATCQRCQCRTFIHR
jgi:hypothetical protein